MLHLSERLASPGVFVSMPAQQSTPGQENIYGLPGVKTGKDEWNDLHFLVTSLNTQ
jgi:hypothetical protein